MDAKVDDWVVTPRRGKAVEINALWYNALRLLARWIEELGERDGAGSAASHARACARRRSTGASGTRPAAISTTSSTAKHGDDAACRPNQVFAISLDYPVLDPRAMEGGAWTSCGTRLLTPVGLRSLAPGHPDYKAKYYGDLRSRDAAYHQGTVWAWLIGPFVDAWLKVYPDDRAGARRLLEGFDAHLSDACVGSISEIFDAEAPYVPRGCIAQAWSVAEVLRCLLKTGRRHGIESPVVAIDLTTLGWDARVDAAFALYAAEGLVPARVVLEHTHIYRVVTAEGEILARVSGRLRHRRRESCGFPDRRRLGRDRSGAACRGCTHHGGAAAAQPLLPAGGRRSHRRTGGGREHRYRVPRGRSRRRLQPAPDRTVPDGRRTRAGRRR